ncbi:MAG: SDR family oxidoreductase [Anaerolineaceae bacterium]|nr:SDR family oxidoreductase [Anaerolineaceae bacterium]MDE0329474.1 SDR family oxidoreductase [Anaerolineaceae bacterium]
MTLAPSTCVVTGGAGFIGSHISERLLRDGHNVRIVDNYLTGSPKNLAHFRDNGRLSVHELDIADAKALANVFEGAEFVLHQAALPSVPRSVASPGETWQHCATGTLNVLEAARKVGVRRLVNASSSSVYGDAPVDSKHEDLPTRPLSPYAAAKLAAEALCQVWGRSYGLETVSLRYFNIYGPRQDPLSDYAAVIPLFISLMLEGQRPPITGDGGETRGFTYVDDVVEGNLLALTSPCAAGQAINIGSGTSTSIRKLVEVLNELLGTQLPPQYVPPRPGDIRHSRADISRAREILGFNPTVDLKTGLKHTLAWFRGQAG